MGETASPVIFYNTKGEGLENITAISPYLKNLRIVKHTVLLQRGITMTRKITLTFSDYASPTLWSTEVTASHLGINKRAIRGKWRGAYLEYGSFEWSKAVQGLCILLLHAKLRSLNPQNWSGPDLVGTGGSFASSLDYAIDKQPVWSVDIFGTDKHGLSYLKRIIDRTNPNRKRPGPVALAMNKLVWTAEEVEVYVDSRSIASEDELATMITRIRDGFVIEKVAA